MIKPVTERGLKQYFEEVGKYKILGRDEEKQLAKRFREKNDLSAKEKLILSNLRIVIHICSRFLNFGLSFSELINAGNRGLIQAVEKFDERKGYRLTTYAVWWIKRAIYEAINLERGIVPKSRLAKRIQAFMPEFVQKKGREPTIQELADALKADQEKVTYALTELMPTLSLDMELDDNIEAPYIEKVLLDEALARYSSESLIAPAPEEIFKKKVEKEKLEKALSKLSHREQEIVKRNFGLDDYEPQSLEEISRVLNITRERVRQIRENALKKLKFYLNTTSK